MAEEERHTQIRKEGKTKYVPKTQYVTVKIPADLFYLIDEEIIKKYGYCSRTEFIKDAIRRMLAEYIK
jgi:metal-responsive CopG/Arc/MetJ family transcriptional regulator